jgi:cell wall-associated NlpC family hydrolase
MPTFLTSMPRRRTSQGCAFAFSAARRSRFLYADLSPQPAARARTRPGGLRLHADAGRDDGPGVGRRPAGSGQAGASRAGQAPGSETEAKAKPKPSLGARAARIALQAVGAPYQWGGASMTSGFDCSGLVYWAYRRLGIELPHSSYALYDRGRRVARSRLRAGDLLFFFFGLGHVGLYLGQGRMVHAPSSGRTVEVVSLRRSHFRGRLIGARRVVSAYPSSTTMPSRASAG